MNSHEKDLQLEIILGLLRSKRAIYELILNQQGIGARAFYKRVLKFAELRLVCERYFLQQLKEDNNILNNKFLVLFYAEIVQNILQAHNQTLKKSREQLGAIKNQNESIDFNLVNQSVVHLTVSFMENTGRILAYSPNAPAFFGYAREDFRFTGNVKNLMPHPYSLVHDLFVDRLVQQKKTRFMCGVDETLVQDKDGYCRIVNKCLYINYSTSHNALPQIECFLSENQRFQDSKQVLFILDAESRLMALSRSCAVWGAADENEEPDSDYLPLMRNRPFTSIYPPFPQKILKYFPGDEPTGATGPETVARTPGNAARNDQTATQTAVQVNLPEKPRKELYRQMQCDMECKRVACGSVTAYIVLLKNIQHPHLGSDNSDQ